MSKKTYFKKSGCWTPLTHMCLNIYIYIIYDTHLCVYTGWCSNIVELQEETEHTRVFIGFCRWEMVETRLRRCIKEMWDSRCKILIVASFWNRWWETCCAWQPLWLYPTVICGHLVFPMHTIHHRTFFSFANHCRFSKGANMCQSKVSYKWMTMPSKISLVSSHVHFTTPVTSCQL